MKLVAIWVEDFMKIQDIGFNFGSSLVFTFDFEKNKRELRITAEPTKDYFDLFKDSSIENITGIVGTNGSGKTSLLKIINIVSAQKPLEHRVIFVFEDKNSSEFHVYSYKAIDPIFDNREKIKILFGDEGYFTKKMKEDGRILVHENKPPFGNIDLVFYSNLYSNQNDNYLKRDNHLNRSVDYQTIKSLSPYRLREYLKAYDRSRNNKNLFAEESYNPLTIYHTDKLKLLITFLANVDSKLALFFQEDIPFPETLTIWANESIGENTFLAVKNQLEDLEKIHLLFDFCVKDSHENNPKQQLKNVIIYSSFFFAFNNEFFKQSDENGTIADIQYFLKKLPIDSAVYEKIKEFMLSQVSSRKNSDINRLKSVLDRLDALLKNIPVRFENGLLARGSFKLEINKSLWRLLSNLNAFRDNNDQPMFTVNLNPFSAGGNAILGQFSEFFEAIKYVKKKNVLVTIDEGELYMHPEWQRKYLYALHNFFNFYGKEHGIKFQIIVTSHSPFLVSDIPRHNLIYMAKNEVGMTEIFSSSDQKSTLGGNIFELFQNGFYMNEFIGEFATNKIDEAIRFLNEEDSSFKNLEEVESFVKLIGEDLIRSELQRIINIKKMADFGNNYEVVKEDELKFWDKNQTDNNKKGKK